MHSTMKRNQTEDCGDAGHMNCQNLGPPPGRSITLEFQTEEDGKQAQKFRVGATYGRSRDAKMDGRLSMDRLQTHCKWEMSVYHEGILGG